MTSYWVTALAITVPPVVALLGYWLTVTNEERPDVSETPRL
jgi:hypothetical protein